MAKYIPLIVFTLSLGGVSMHLAKRCEELERKCYEKSRPHYHDGWCTLMCFEGRCKCHDHCGPLCNTWRELVLDGIIEPTGYKYVLTEKDIIECLLANRKAVR